MNFVYPNFLWALFVLLIPIIVHLFNFRRYKTVYFSRVKHLKEVVEDSKAGAKLKHLLVLLARLLALACLVIAFAQPYIPTEEGTQTENLTSIYIDNSYSMQAEGNDGDLLNEVKNQAIELVKSLEANERISLMTSDLLSVQQRFYSKSEIIDMIKQIDYSAKTTALQDALRMQADLLVNDEKQGNRRIFVLSDFQKSTSALSNWERPEIQTYFYQAQPVVKDNVFIDSIWFKSPVHRVDAPVDVYFRVRNTADADLEDMTARLSINGNEPAPKRFSVPAGSYTDEKITFTDRSTGTKNAKISLKTAQLFFDDDFYFTYDIKNQVEILLIRGEADKNLNLEQLYNLDPYYQCKTVSTERVIPEDFNGKELIILQNADKLSSGIGELLNEAVDNGASVVLIPGPNVDKTAWNSYLGAHQLPTLQGLDTTNRELSYFNAEDPIYAGVFEETPSNYKYPQLFAQYNLQTLGNQNFITLFGMGARSPYFLYQKEGNGKVFLMASPLLKSYTNFQNQALFAATFLRIAETASFQKPLYTTIGKMDNFPVQQEISEKLPVHLINEDLKVDVIPQLTTVRNSRSISFNHLENELKTAGFYTLTDKADFNKTIGLNYNRAESYTASFTPEEIKTQFAELGWKNTRAFDLNTSGAIEINQLKATEYWRILLILAVLFLALEVLLLKRWKR